MDSIYLEKNQTNSIHSSLPLLRRGLGRGNKKNNAEHEIFKFGIAIFHNYIMGFRVLRNLFIKCLWTGGSGGVQFVEHR
jgi:hypothetical protein